ncbi:MAG: hypothetical protein ACR2GT_12190 [Gaiellaceae bacterium]
MTLVRRLLRLLGAAFAFGVYVWYAAVRHAPTVKRRKARRRLRLRGRSS